MMYPQRPDIKIDFVDHLESKDLFVWAASNGHTEIIKLLLAHPEIRVNEKNSNENTALISAASNGHTEIVRFLLARPEIQVYEKERQNLRCGD